jgi:hypothetical protein
MTLNQTSNRDYFIELQPKNRAFRNRERLMIGFSQDSTIQSQLTVKWSPLETSGMNGVPVPE